MVDDGDHEEENHTLTGRSHRSPHVKEADIVNGEREQEEEFAASPEVADDLDDLSIIYDDPRTPGSTPAKSVKGKSPITPVSTAKRRTRRTPQSPGTPTPKTRRTSYTK